MSAFTARLAQDAIAFEYVNLKDLPLETDMEIIRFKPTNGVFGKGIMVFFRHGATNKKAYLPPRFAEDAGLDGDMKKYNSGQHPRMTFAVLSFTGTSANLSFKDVN